MINDTGLNLMTRAKFLPIFAPFPAVNYYLEAAP